MKKKLKRELSFFDLIIIGIVGAVGTGILFSTAAMTGSAGPGSWIAWLLGGLFYLFIGLTYSELVTTYPEAGGPSRYALYTYGWFTNIINSLADLIFYNLKSHKDGWGAVFFSDNNEMYFRSTEPFYKSDLSFIPNFSYFYGIVHARFSAPNEPIIGSIHSHPFLSHGENEILYIAHNGWIDKRAIGERFGIKYEIRNDTEVFSLLLEKEEGNIRDRIINTIEFTKNYAMLGALNLFCIISRYDNKKEICYYSKYKDENIYIKLFKYENRENFAVMSSSVGYEMGFIDGNGKITTPQVEEVPQDTLFLNGKKW
ncbi:MAG: GerAB/ArcD/ProY family transporter [Thermoplasmata archaeon]